MKRIFINIFFELFLFIYPLVDIYCCCCFQCANIETKEEKDERLRNEQIKKENALRNKLFNIICSHVGECRIKFKVDKVQCGGYSGDSFCDEFNKRIEKIYSFSTLSPRDKDPQIVDVYVNEENNFVIKHEGVDIVVKFYITSDFTYGRVYVYGKYLPSKLGIRQYGEPIIFYYSDDEKFFKLKNGKIIGDDDKPVNNFMDEYFDCLKCSYFSDNCFYIDFYKVFSENY